MKELPKSHPHHGVSQEDMAVLRKRLETVSREVSDSKEVEGSDEILGFHIGEDQYAMRTSSIVSVLKLGELCKVPFSPAHIAGIINFHGEIITVLNLPYLLGNTSWSPPANATMMLLEDKASRLAILVDRISSIQDIDLNILHEPVTAQGDRRYVTSVTEEGVMIVSAEAIFNDNSIIVNQTVS